MTPFKEIPVDIIYSDTGDRPAWSQGQYQYDLFQIFAASYDCRIHGDQIRPYLKDQWFPRKELSKAEQNEVFESHLLQWNRKFSCRHELRHFLRSTQVILFQRLASPSATKSTQATN